MIRWIAFDAVGTLISPTPDVALAYYQIGRRHGSQATVQELRSQFWNVFQASVSACLPSNDGHVVTSEELECRRWRWIVERLLPDVTDATACFQELYEHFALPINWKVFDDVQPTLIRLHEAGYRLAMASNFDQRLTGIVAATQELRRIEKVIVSTSVGYCKPSSRFYSAVLKVCECEPEEIVMIGDEHEADVVGPMQLGIRALQIDRKASDGLYSLHQVPGLLSELVN